MVRDYHMHPQILTKPELFAQFVETARMNGIEEICITDHMPLIGSSAKDRLPAGSVREYCATAKRLKEHYRDVLSVKLGIEIDFHPTVTDQIERVLDEGEFDWILGSSHLHALPGLEIVKNCKNGTQYTMKMYENTAAAAESGWFTAIAHFDMYRWIFSRPDRFPLEDDGFREEDHKDVIDDVLKVIAAKGLRLEINTHFAVSQEDLSCVYPSPMILNMAAEKGIPFSFGSDAHKPEDVGALLPELRQSPVYGKAIRVWEAE